MTKLLALSALGVAIVAAALALAVSRQRREITDLVAARNAVVSDIASRRDNLERAIVSAGQQRNALAAELVVTERGLARLEQASQTNPVEAAFERMRESPEYAPFRYREQRRRIQKELGPFLSRLGLPPTELERLKNLLVERLDAPREARVIAQKEGFAPDSRQARLLASRASSDAEKGLREFLGPEAYARYKDFVSIQRNASVVEQIQVAIADAGIAALSPEQSEALARARRDVQANERYTNHAKDSAAEFKAKRLEADQDLVDRMRTTLRPDQLSALADYLRLESDVFIRTDELTR